MIEVGPDVCGDLDQALGREWLETNGLGGFASSSIAGAHTRRYHGLLVAALRPPVERYVLLSKLEETLVVDGQAHELSTNEYPGAVHPEGYRCLTGFRLDPFPIAAYRVGEVTVEKVVFMVHDENTTVVQYRLVSAPAGARVRLELRPLIAFRGYHQLTHENPVLNPQYHQAAGRLVFAPYLDLPALHMAHSAYAVETQGFWYRDFQYRAERERGLDFSEDLFNPALLRFDLGSGSAATVIASTEPHDVHDAEALCRSELSRRQQIAASAPGEEPLLRRLALAADQFIVRRGDGCTVIAGYPWFTDWGRDTMIALPGLALTTGRFDAARGILIEFAQHVDCGMLPNRFPDVGEKPEYNTVDATLWFFQAVDAYARRSGDETALRDRLYGILAGIVDWHVRGTRHGIRVDEDGLLRAGEEGVQLTWMDAKVRDWVVTPRQGRPVEIQALWYNALRIMEEWARRFGDAGRAAHFGSMAARASRSFNRLFWNAESGCLYDVLGDAGPDSSIRPNQIIAAGLPHSMLSRDRRRKVVDVVQRHLLTPYGLRTLSPEDPRYSGVYEGDVGRRDGTYHQGTVWPWLMGPFITAYLRAYGPTKARQMASAWVEPFRAHLCEAGLGQVSEILDGDAPHRPRGCIAQAWSVAELLRAFANL